MTISLARRIGLSLAAPALATVFALGLAAIVLLVSGSNPIDAFGDMIENGRQLETSVDMINRATRCSSPVWRPPSGSA